MSNKEEEFLLSEAKPSFFEVTDGSSAPIGDLFRGPSTGITSELDLKNPGRSLERKETKYD